MAPIRIALIGLSASSTTSWAAEAHLPYLLSARGKQHYTIVALLNSSQQVAEAARSTFALSPDVKTYGDPELWPRIRTSTWSSSARAWTLMSVLLSLRSVPAKLRMWNGHLLRITSEQRLWRSTFTMDQPMGW